MGSTATRVGSAVNTLDPGAIAMGRAPPARSDAPAEPCHPSKLSLYDRVSSLMRSCIVPTEDLPGGEPLSRLFSSLVAGGRMGTAAPFNGLALS